MSKRHKDAIAIQEGACNPVAIAHTLYNHSRDMMQAQMDSQALRDDPALRMIAHQLAFLFDVGSIDSEPSVYSRLIDECRHEANKGA